MRLDRLLPLSSPVRQPGRKEERPPRRQPADSEHPDGPGQPTGEAETPSDRPVPPDHVDITV
jgi:hypothetical protein